MLLGRYNISTREKSPHLLVHSVQTVIKSYGFGTLALAICPSNGGWNGIRMRLLVFGFDVSAFLVAATWDNRQEHFGNLFNRLFAFTVDAMAGVYGVSNMKKETMKRAKARGIHGLTHMLDLPLPGWISPGRGSERCDLNQKSYQELQGNHVKGPPYMSVISQAGDGSHLVSNRWIPPINNSSCLISLTKTLDGSDKVGRFLTSSKLGYSEGWLVLGVASRSYGPYVAVSDWNGHFSSMQMSELRSNGMHLYAMGSFIYDIVSHLMDKHKLVAGTLRTLSQLDDSSDGD